MFYAASSHAALASDWEEEELSPRPRVSIPEATNTLPPFSGVATPGTIASSGWRLHFRQAIDALELEILANRNSKQDINTRLDVLEKAVFGETKIEELPDNMQRLHRLLSAVPLSESSLSVAAGKNIPGQMDGGGGGSTSTSQNAGAAPSGGKLGRILGLPRDAAGGANRVLHSPTFWTLVGVAGALVCGYLLARSLNNSYYENPCVSNVNPNHQWVNYPRYDSSGRMISAGYWRTAANGTMTDNFSSTCNVNPYTGKLGYTPPWH